MVNSTLVKDLNRLVSRPKKVITLPDRPIAARVLGARGVGEKKEVIAASGGTTGELHFVETLLVYSEIIITEDGAFEKPLGWPLSTMYEFSAVAPDPLPQSMFFLLGRLHLDLKVQYYLQKRVHLAFYEQLDGTTVVGDRQDNRYVRYEYPYVGGYSLGTSAFDTDVPPELKGEVVASAVGVTLEKQLELSGQGVSFV